MNDYKNAASSEEMESLNDEAIQGEVVDGGEPLDDNIDKLDGLGADACNALAGTVFELIALRRGQHWRLKQDETESIGGALDQVLSKYMPDMGSFGAEASLVLITVALVMPRLQAEGNESGNESENEA